jgi:hypothetical protein
MRKVTAMWAMTFALTACAESKGKHIRSTPLGVAPAPAEACLVPLPMNDTKGELEVDAPIASQPAGDV